MSNGTDINLQTDFYKSPLHPTPQTKTNKQTNEKQKTKTKQTVSSLESIMLDKWLKNSFKLFVL